MKILMFGRGVISSIYGWALEKAGHEVHFYVRPGRTEHYGDQLHMQLYDLRRGFFSPQLSECWHTILHEEISAEHDYDLIILSVQHYNFVEAAETVASFIGDATVLIFNNFWDEPQQAASMLPADQLVWGFPGAGGGIVDNVLRGALFGFVTFGTFGKPLSVRERAVRALFTQSGFKIQEEIDFRGWLLIHFVQNAGLQSEFLLSKHEAKRALTFATFYNMARNVKELVPLLEARGVDLSAHSSAARLRFPAFVSGAILWMLFILITPLRWVLDAHANPREITSTCLVIFEDAHHRGIFVPRLESKYAAKE